MPSGRLRGMSELLDGCEGIPGFLAAWYGPPDLPAGPTVPGAGRLPRALREWYEITSRYARPVLFNCKVFPVDEACEYDGVIGFCMDDFEYQEFGFAPSDEDPPVLCRMVGGGEPWEPMAEGLTLSKFLHVLLAWESVEGARHAASADELTLDQLKVLLAPLRLLPGPKEVPTLYVGEGLLAHTWPNLEAEGRWHLRLAARTDGLLGYAEAVPGVTFGPGEWWPDPLAPEYSDPVDDGVSA